MLISTEASASDFIRMHAGEVREGQTDALARSRAETDQSQFVIPAGTARKRAGERTCRCASSGIGTPGSLPLQTDLPARGNVLSCLEVDEPFSLLSRGDLTLR